MRQTLLAPEPQFCLDLRGFVDLSQDASRVPGMLSLEEAFGVAAESQQVKYLSGAFQREIPDDLARLGACAKASKIGIGAIELVFDPADYPDGALTNGNPALRTQAIQAFTHALKFSVEMGRLIEESGLPPAVACIRHRTGNEGGGNPFAKPYAYAWKFLINAYINILQLVKDGKICIDPTPFPEIGATLVHDLSSAIFLTEAVRNEVQLTYKEKFMRRGGDTLSARAFFRELDDTMRMIEGRIVQMTDLRSKPAGGDCRAEEVCRASDYGSLVLVDVPIDSGEVIQTESEGWNEYLRLLEAEYWLYWKGFDGLWNLRFDQETILGASAYATASSLTAAAQRTINAVLFRRQIITTLPSPEELLGTDHSISADLVLAAIRSAGG